jgi:ribosomal protein S18 acetylase RimI-like enzyme
MAALVEPELLRLCDLREIDAAALAPLLEEEIGVWQSRLHWDFRASADLVKRFVSMRALHGCALLLPSGRAVGYCYYVVEERKGLIGDLYLMESFHAHDNEDRLLEQVITSLGREPHLRRIESQLMMLRPRGARPVPFSAFAQLHERRFMMISQESILALPRRAQLSFRLEPWTGALQETAAQIIAAAYDGHVDSTINDQYRSRSGARRFLQNIVQYPGCGSFFAPASLVAFHLETGEPCGICLASMVAPDVGHITQICVAPQYHGAGIGYGLLRRSLRSLAERGCRGVSLTVTAANTEAVALYERTGFVDVRRFSACVWENFSR